MSSPSKYDAPRWVQALQSGVAKVAAAAHRRPLAALIAAGLLTVLAGAQARTLRIDADIANLLPESFESLKALDEVERRFGGVGYVVVVATGAQPEVLKRFAEGVSPSLEALPSVRYVDYKRSNSWFRERALYYMDLDDLAYIQEQIEDRANYERRKANPLLVDLEDNAAPSLDFSKIEAKYKARATHRSINQVQAEQDYYLDEEANMIALLIKPTNLVSNLDFAKQVVSEVQTAVDGLDLSAYPGLKVELTGRYKKKLDQQRSIEGDLGTTSGLALLLMLLYLVLHFRRLSAIGFIMAPLLVSMVWTFGLAATLFDSLNILTGFVGAILLGLGIDHGIHLLGRYQSERAAGQAADAAIEKTFASTGRAVLLAAITTLVGFLGLSFTDVRAFREFGQMAAWGTASVVLAYTLLLPALLGLAGKLRWSASGHGPSPVIAAYAGILPKWGPSLFWLSSVGLFFVAIFVGGTQFDYDFASLHGGDLPSYRLDRTVNAMLGRSQTPLVVLLDKAEQEQVATEAIRARSTALGEASGVDFVASTVELLPADQDEKQEVLQAIQSALGDFDPELLSAEDREQYTQFKAYSGAEPFAFEDLPIEVRRQFSPTGARPEGGILLIFPSVSLSDGEAVVELGKEVRDLDLGDGSTASAAGGPMVLADVLGMIFAESPRIIALTMLLVFLALWLLLGRLSLALLCFLPAPITVLATMGAAHLLGLHINYINMVIVPVLFGIAVDAGVHLVLRGVQSSDNLVEVVQDVGRAVVGASVTTAFGFGTLMLAHHPGLSSFSQLALLGLGINLIVSMVWLTALLALRHVRVARITAVGHWNSFTGRLATDLGTVFGAGYSAKAPGTFGAWAALPLGYALAHVALWPRLAIVTGLIVVSFPIAARYMRGSMSALDPQEIVYDELIGVLMPLAIVPWTWGWVAAAFIAFRFFDITKPGPVGWVDKNMKGPAGVMLDDVVAGAIAAAILLAARLYVFDIPLS